MKNLKKIIKQKYLDDDQHGGRNGRAAIDIVLGRAFVMETAHLKRENIRCTDCDAKSCYDRIIPMVLLLAYVKAGLPYKTAKFFVKLLYKMRYRISTAYGLGAKVNFMVGTLFFCPGIRST